MIPKIIHYCWFGDKHKPKKVLACIESWKKFMPDYTIIEWNEKNFDVNYNSYTNHAYKNKKYAFISDVARLNALYKYGGIYFDTDVEVYKKFDDLLNEKCIFGFEEKNYIATSFMACEPGLSIIKNFISYYNAINYDGKTTNVKIFTHLLENKGLCKNNRNQTLENYIHIYPQDYFSPFDYINYVDKSSKNTYCIHYYDVSWLSGIQKHKHKLKKWLKTL